MKETIKQQIPSQLIWSLVTCCLFLIVYLSIELIKFAPTAVDNNDESSARIEQSNGNQVQLSISKSMLALYKNIGISEGAAKGNNLTDIELEKLQTYLQNHILIPSRNKTKINFPTTTEQIEIIETTTMINNSSTFLKNSTLGLAAKLKELIGGQKNGFYIESRARNGTNFNSFTFSYLEQQLNWSGLLVEGVPSLIQQLQSQNRQAWIAKTCLSQNTTQYMEYFWRKDNNNSVSVTQQRDSSSPALKLFNPTKLELNKKLNGEPNRIIECFSLNLLLKAIFPNNNNNYNNETIKIDLLILDLDGNEYKILNSILSDDLISIKIIVVQHWLVPEGKNAFKGLMYTKKYFLTYESNSHYIFIQKKALLGEIVII